MSSKHIVTACATGALLIASLAATTQARAEGESPHSFTANVALTTNYMFRGVSQTGNGPAVQGGFDYSYTPLGLYAGVWGSNVDSGSTGTGYWIDNTTTPPTETDELNPNAEWVTVSLPGYDEASMELDLKLGWAKTFDKLGVDIGYLRYEYPMTNTEANNTNEYHLALSYDLTVSVPLPYDFSLTGHYGWTVFDDDAFEAGSYDDYSVGIATTYAGVGFALSWIDRSKTENCISPFNCGSTAVFTISKTF
ncbi:MAG TPA: TorF family putative porin [Chromatiaceae bacterium]|nr:TorF family putative porin [Chromatiaceae bacterium]